MSTGRNDLTIPHKCDAVYICSAAGADLDKIESFTSELTVIVDKMKEDLTKETRLFEGTQTPKYETLLQNELSHLKEVEQQWKTGSKNGSWTQDLTDISEPVSSTSSCSAEHSNPNLVTPSFGNMCLQLPTDCSMESSGNCGSETDAMNECSECTVPMTSELMHGMPSELR